MPWAEKPRGAVTDPSISVHGPSGSRDASGAAGISNEPGRDDDDEEEEEAPAARRIRVDRNDDERDGTDACCFAGAILARDSKVIVAGWECGCGRRSAYACRAQGAGCTHREKLFEDPERKKPPRRL